MTIPFSSLTKSEAPVRVVIIILSSATQRPGTGAACFPFVRQPRNILNVSCGRRAGILGQSAGYFPVPPSEPPDSADGSPEQRHAAVTRLQGCVRHLETFPFCAWLMLQTLCAAGRRRQGAGGQGRGRTHRCVLSADRDIPCPGHCTARHALMRHLGHRHCVMRLMLPHSSCSLSGRRRARAALPCVRVRGAWLNGFAQRGHGTVIGFGGTHAECASDGKMHGQVCAASAWHACVQSERTWFNQVA